MRELCRNNKIHRLRHRSDRIHLTDTRPSTQQVTNPDNVLADAPGAVDGPRQYQELVALPCVESVLAAYRGVRGLILGRSPVFFPTKKKKNGSCLMVSLKSGSLHLGSASAHPSSPFAHHNHKIVNFTRLHRDLFGPPQGGVPFLGSTSSSKP